MSQKQAIICLLDKKKDRTLLKNWRPISLLNVDYKIMSKSLVNRIKPFLNEMINISQTAYVATRNIQDNIRLIADIMYYTKHENKQGFLLSIDFEKAFDTIDTEFLLLVLHKFNFGASFIKWINLIYTESESCVINNGQSSGYFNISRGVRQGDPLSPYLFIMVAEILYGKIQENNNIKGITVKDKEIKMCQYADDTTGFIADKRSLVAFLKTVDAFGRVSGLRMNKEKNGSNVPWEWLHRKQSVCGS